MRSFYVALFMTASVAFAQDAPPPPKLEPVPDSPVDLESAKNLEPEVTIRRREGEVIEEYRVNGQLYMVKITPKKGIPYVLIDGDGDGSLETRRSDLDPNFMVPGWVILRWR